MSLVEGRLAKGISTQLELCVQALLAARATELPAFTALDMDNLSSIESCVSVSLLQLNTQDTDAENVAQLSALALSWSYPQFALCPRTTQSGTSTESSPSKVAGQ